MIVMVGRENDSSNSRVERMLAEAGPVIDQFCSRYRVRLTEAVPTDERGHLEPIFYFSDGLGGYTLDAVRGSL